MAAADHESPLSYHDSLNQHGRNKALHRLLLAIVVEPVAPNLGPASSSPAVPLYGSSSAPQYPHARRFTCAMSETDPRPARISRAVVTDPLYPHHL